MTQRIIYKTDEGGVAIVIPTFEALKTMTIAEIAAKDVPAGKEFKIVSEGEIPTDRTFRDAWEYVSEIVEEPVAEETQEVTK